MSKLHKVGLIVSPEERLEQFTLLAASYAADALEQPCSGLVSTYKALCNFYQIKPSDALCWDLANLFTGTTHWFLTRWFRHRCFRNQLRKVHRLLRGASDRGYREPYPACARHQQPVFPSDRQKYEVHERCKFPGPCGNVEVYNKD